VSRPVLLSAVLCLAGAGARAQQPARPGQMPVLPLTQLDERALAADLDNRAFSLTFAQPVPIRDLLLLLVRGTSLSVVPDPAIAGSFIGELKNVTVRQALGLVLPPLGLDYAVDGSFIRVLRRAPETRMFDINYLASQRSAAVSVGGPIAGGSSASVSTTTTTDVFTELAAGVRTILSDQAVFNVDRKAGLLQVTDFPDRLERIALYLEAVHDRVHRQVQIEARILEVELNDPEAAGLDWDALERPNRATPGFAPSSGVLRVADVPGFLEALGAQGKVSVLAAPRIVALNNEPALVRAVSERADERQDSGLSDDHITLVVTPQVASDGTVMLSLSPMVGVRDEPRDNAQAARVLREADTLARVSDGDTIVVSGFARTIEVRERRPGGSRGGWFGRATVTTRKRVELVILLTARVLIPGV
jgi:type II secretory pathway component GspD/PulD (secretin)